VYMERPRISTSTEEWPVPPCASTLPNYSP
jgi:hypothetical protein